MKTTNFHLYLTDSELALLIRCLVNLKNDQLQQGRYTDAVDDILYKVGKAKPKKLKIKYVFYIYIRYCKSEQMRNILCPQRSSLTY